MDTALGLALLAGLALTAGAILLDTRQRVRVFRRARRDAIERIAVHRPRGG